jgi:hypothetical protein
LTRTHPVATGLDFNRRQQSSALRVRVSPADAHREYPHTWQIQPFIRTLCLHLAVIQPNPQLGNSLCDCAFGLATQTAQVEECMG